MVSQLLLLTQIQQKTNLPLSPSLGEYSTIWFLALETPQQKHFFFLFGLLSTALMISIFCFSERAFLFLSAMFLAQQAMYTNKKRNRCLSPKRKPASWKRELLLSVSNLLIRTVIFWRANVFISEARSCGDQASGVLIRECSYSRGPYMRVFISNNKEQLWQGH